MEYNELVKALRCDGNNIGQDSGGCTNKKCRYRDQDSACNIVSICEDAAAAITDLLVENQSLRNAANGFKARAEAAEARAEKAQRERDEAVETIFKWTGCAECKNWQSDTDWCEKHDRYATISDGCSTPEWRGIKEE